jgi:hypothetical protein
MALTSDEIEQIERAAAKLDDWRTRAIERSFGDLGSYIPLQAVVETQVNQAIDILLTRMPALGEAVRADLDRLLRQAKLAHDLSEQNAQEARLKEVELFGVARPLISRLRRIAQKAREELISEKPAETEQNAIHRIWTLVKRIPRWIYVLVLFLAALLTCIYLSWWLWTTFWKK